MTTFDEDFPQYPFAITKKPTTHHDLPRLEMAPSNIGRRQLQQERITRTIPEKKLTLLKLIMAGALITAALIAALSRIITTNPLIGH